MPRKSQRQQASNKVERERLGLDGANPNDPYYGAMAVTPEYKKEQEAQQARLSALHPTPNFYQHMPAVANPPGQIPIDLYPSKYSMSTNSTPTRRENMRMNGLIGGPLSSLLGEGEGEALPGEGGKKRRKTMKRKAMKGKTMKRKTMKRKTMKRKTRRKINKKK